MCRERRAHLNFSLQVEERHLLFVSLLIFFVQFAILPFPSEQAADVSAIHFPAPGDLCFPAAVLTVADVAAEAPRFDVFRLLNLKLKLSLAAAILKASLLCDVKKTATTIARGCGALT
jgi:hypothetical protein